MRFITRNGWTKDKMKSEIRLRNRGTPAKDVIDIFTAVCRYRAKDGNACAVGCFIPEDVYLQKFEGRGVNALLSQNPDLEKYMPIDVEGLAEMQHIHDSADKYKDPRDIREILCEWIDNHVLDEKPKHAIERNLA